MCVFDHKSENEICSTTAAAGKRVIHLQCCHRFQKGPTHLESPPLFFLPLSCWLATYKFSSRFNWYKKFGHNGMQWALKMWTNFSKEKVSVAVKGVGWLWYQKSNENCVPRQDNVPSLLFEEKQFFSILGRIECNPIWMLKSSNFPQWFQRFDFTMYSS